MHKPGGRFVAIREHVISREDDLSRFLELHPLHKHYGGDHAYLLEQYVAAIEQSGLANLRVLSPWQARSITRPIVCNAQGRAGQADGLGHSGRRPRDAYPAGSAWPLASRVLGLFDNLPGRLYSFVATRP